MQPTDIALNENAREVEEPARWRIARTILTCLLVIKFALLVRNHGNLDGFALVAFITACSLALLVELGRRIVLARRAKA
jgi:hypothetical protein